MNALINNPVTIDRQPSGSPSEKILPDFFREAADQLYACHHFPVAPSSGEEAGLICNATGHEYERCHRAMRQLAVQLSKTGRHVMRFDYFGTGDSAGEYSQASLVQWRKDVSDAIDECKRFSGRDRVCVIGVRLGATVAAQAVAGRDDVNALVLYAPVIEGKTLLAEWERYQAEHDRSHGRPGHTGISKEVLGFPLTAAFRAELYESMALPEPGPDLGRVLILSDRAEEKDAKQLAKMLGSRGAKVWIEPADASPIWHREPFDAIVPFKLLRRIAAWLDEVEQ